MKREAVEKAVELAGLQLPDHADFEITGEEPLYPSPHRLGEGAAVARLMTGLAAAELWRTRTGHAQQVSVDAVHAAATLASYVHFAQLDEDRRQQVEDARAALAQRTRLTSIVPTADGRHVQLHASFNDGPKILEELGLDEASSREDVAAAVKRRQAEELQAAFIGRKVCGGVVYSKDEWAAHPQGRAIAGLPVVSITKIGEAPPEPLPEGGDRPTSGVRVVDLTRVLAGPTCAKTIAEHGADVLHISAPGLERGGLFEQETGIGKRQAVVDLREPGQDDVLRGLVRDADVFSQGYRLGTLARRGFAPDQVAVLRPGIVYVSENCYGHVGPWAERPGWEQLGQAATGMSFREGQAAPDRTPRLAPAAVNDYSTGFFAAYGAMTALRRRATEGGSWHVQVSLSQTCMWYQRLGDDNDPAAYTRADLSPYLAEMDTPDFGRIRYLAPAVTMSHTPARWDRPPARQGAHEPAWLPR